MKSLFNHIERAREKPHHIRRQIAFSSATVITAFITLVWLVGSIGTGAFALKNNVIADNGTRDSVNQSVAGAAAALSQPKNEKAHIEIVDVPASTTPQTQAEQTTIPF